MGKFGNEFASRGWKGVIIAAASMMDVAGCGI
jgi:hypothetical protein